MENLEEQLTEAVLHEQRLRAELKMTIALVRSLESLVRLKSGGDANAGAAGYEKSPKIPIKELIKKVFDERGGGGGTVLRVAEIAEDLKKLGRAVSVDTIAGIISREIKENQTFEKVKPGHFQLRANSTSDD